MEALTGGRLGWIPKFPHSHLPWDSHREAILTKEWRKIFTTRDAPQIEDAPEQSGCACWVCPQLSQAVLTAGWKVWKFPSRRVSSVWTYLSVDRHQAFWASGDRAISWVPCFWSSNQCGGTAVTSMLVSYQVIDKFHKLYNLCGIGCELKGAGWLFVSNLPCYWILLVAHCRHILISSVATYIYVQDCTHELIRTAWLRDSTSCFEGINLLRNLDQPASCFIVLDAQKRN